MFFPITLATTVTAYSRTTNIERTTPKGHHADDDETANPEGHSEDSFAAWKIVVIVFSSILVVILIALVFCCCRIHKRKRKRKKERTGSPKLAERPVDQRPREIKKSPKPAQFHNCPEEPPYSSNDDRFRRRSPAPSPALIPAVSPQGVILIPADYRWVFPDQPNQPTPAVPTPIPPNFWIQPKAAAENFWILPGAANQPKSTAPAPVPSNSPWAKQPQSTAPGPAPSPNRQNLPKSAALTFKMSNQQRIPADAWRTKKAPGPCNKASKYESKKIVPALLMPKEASRKTGYYESAKKMKTTTGATPSEDARYYFLSRN